MFFVTSTRFANLSQRSAILLIAIVFLTIVFGFIGYHPMLPKEGKGGDLMLYKRIVERIHGGEAYYAVTGEELRTRGYTSRSVFNWRLPPLGWSLGQLPSVKTGQVLAVILASMTLLAWMTVFQQSQYSLKQFIAGGLLLAGPVIYSLLPGPFLMHEFWAGTLIALSLAAYGRGWRYTSVICGLMALFLRELTLPFVCVMMVLAYREGHRREAIVWLIGIVVFGGELLLHWSIVNKLVTEKDLVLEGGWIVFGGWSFVLDTARMQPLLLIAPPWVTAIILPLALLGLAGWRGPLGSRVAATVGIYVLAFSVAGRSFNLYWGLMYISVMPFGLFYAFYTLKDLWPLIFGKVSKQERHA